MGSTEQRISHLVNTFPPCRNVLVSLALATHTVRVNAPNLHILLLEGINSYNASRTVSSVLHFIHFLSSFERKERIVLELGVFSVVVVLLVEHGVVPGVVVGLEGEDGGAEEEEDDQEQAGHLQTVLSLHQTEPG